MVCRIICCQVEIIFAFNNFEKYIWNHMNDRLQSYKPSKSCFVHGSGHLMGTLQNHHFEITWQLNTTQFILVTPVTWHFYKWIIADYKQPFYNGFSNWKLCGLCCIHTTRCQYTYWPVQLKQKIHYLITKD